MRRIENKLYPSLHSSKIAVFQIHFRESVHRYLITQNQVLAGTRLFYEGMFYKGLLHDFSHKNCGMHLSIIVVIILINWLKFH